MICETPSEEFIALRLADSSEFSWDITQFSYELIFNSLRIWSQSCPDQRLSTNQLAKLQALYAYWSSPAKPSVLYHPDEPSLDILISEGKWKVLGSIVQGYRFPTSRPQACAQLLSKILDNGVGRMPVQSMAIGCAHTIIHAVHASLAKVQALMDQKTRASTPMYTSLSEWSFEKLPECLEQCQRLFRYYPGLADHEELVQMLMDINSTCSNLPVMYSPKIQQSCSWIGPLLNRVRLSGFCRTKILPFEEGYPCI